MGGPLRCVARRTHWPRDSAVLWRDRAASGEYGSASLRNAPVMAEPRTPRRRVNRRLLGHDERPKAASNIWGSSTLRASLYHPAVALGRCNRPNPARGISTNTRKYESRVILVHGPPTDRVHLQIQRWTYSKSRGGRHVSSFVSRVPTPRRPRVPVVYHHGKTAREGALH
jgi:hypothetical protein